MNKLLSQSSMLCSSLKKFGVSRIILLSIPVLLVLYTLSYGPVVLACEKIGIPLLGYLIYEPVEAFRFQYDLLYKITEKSYSTLGGGTDPENRSFIINSKRR